MLTLLIVALLASVGAAEAKPRNGRIIFNDPSKLHSMLPDGSGHRTTTTGGYGTEGYAGPGPNRLTFPGSESLDIVNTSDASLVERLYIRGGSWIGGAEWAPSGREVVFNMCEKTVFTDIDDCVSYGVYRFARGDRTRRVAGGSAASWSPDGRSLVLMREIGKRDAGRNECYGIYRARRNGSRLRRVLPRSRTCLANFGNPHFSADGRRIVFQHGRGVFSVRPDGKARRRIVEARRGLALTTFELSPDRRRIAYLVNGHNGPRGEIYVTGARTGGPGRRIRRTRYTNWLAWLPR